MNHIGPAILLAQPIVAGSGIEDERVSPLHRVREREQGRSARIGNDVGGAGIELLLRVGKELGGLALWTMVSVNS